MFGAIEAGGTKFVCAVGTNPNDLKITQFSTTSPEATTASAIEFLREQSAGELDAVGIGSSDQSIFVSARPPLAISLPHQNQDGRITILPARFAKPCKCQSDLTPT